MKRVPWLERASASILTSRSLFFILFSCLLAASASQADPLETGFRKPPAGARPWVYWFWLNGNITRHGITADLEAMRRVGIGGALIMEVDQGAPVGPVDFMSPRWRELFGHVHAEARRLGLEINMNNDAGWNGSGGPWIKPEQAMQELVWSETNVLGPLQLDAPLPHPPVVAGFYREIAVQAFPAVGGERIANIATKGAFQRRDLHPAAPVEPVLPKFVDPSAVTNLAARFDPAGRLTWEVPAGRWTIVRYGHTCTGVENAPAPASGRGLECDKLSREGMDAAFAGMMAKLAADNRLKPAGSRAGLVATHIDSWENGSQNWTARMAEEFQQRRGYALLPFLPVLTGRVLGNAELSERFLWDVRQTVSELVIENYAGRMRELAHTHGMRFTVEAYGSPCDAIPYAGQSDEPMGEFWTPSGALETCKGMASAAHVYGQPIVGAEACTSGDRERWLEHPALLKSHVDRAFCEGINRMVFHRYALQPWPGERVPGMTMGPWGQHYERSQTWWEWTPGWHRYLARCQFMLRQGLFVADICYIQPEAPPQGPGSHPRDGYDWDECTAEGVVSRMSVRDGRLVLPDGMSYRVLALPWSQTMTPRLLRKVRELVEAGATVLGPRPTTSPSLSGFPQCDAEVKEIAAKLWGEADDQRVKEHRQGQGRVVISDAPAAWLRDSGVPADFSSDASLRFLHRRAGETDVYFVANLDPWALTSTCSFRVEGRIPELWWPESGRIERAAVWQVQDDLTHVSIPFDPSGSVFVFFRHPIGRIDPVVALRRDGKLLLAATPEPPAKIHVTQARYGVLEDAQSSRDVTALVQQKVDAGESRFPVRLMAAIADPAPNREKTLAVDYVIEGLKFSVKARDSDLIQLHRGVLSATVDKARYGVLDDPKRTRDMRDRIQRWINAGLTSFKVADLAQGDDPAFLVVKTLDLEITRNGQRQVFTGQDPDTIHLVPATAQPQPPAALRGDRRNRLALEVTVPGGYEWLTVSGRSGQARVDVGERANEIPGPWQVRFQQGRGAPAAITLDALVPLDRHAESGVRFFSGEANYETTFVRPPAAKPQSANSHLPSPICYLDLGSVEVMARVVLNGKDLGTLWKPPFRLEITQALKPGRNRLEVRVVNRWPNRLVGDEQLPEDSERNPDGTLKQWPAWLLENKPSPTGRHTFTSWRLWKRDEPLPPSGLLGPVRIVTVPRFSI